VFWLITLLVLNATAVARGETLESALKQAYAGNPQLNAGRAGVRADETVAQAQAGYRPTVSMNAGIGLALLDGTEGGERIRQATLPGQVGITVTQTLFNGFQTDNTTQRARSTVNSRRESLHFTELTTLFNAAQAYMDVLRDSANVELQRNNFAVLQEQIRQTAFRFRIGEITRSDVAQAEERLADARSQVSASEAQLRSSIGIYRQVIGIEPRQFAPGRPLDHYVPGGLNAAIDIGLKEQPQILSQMHAVDATKAQVKVLEGQLYPIVGLQGPVAQSYDRVLTNTSSVAASIVGRLTIPVYQGGQEYTQIRQAKEQAEQARDQICAAVVSAWGQLEATKARVAASQAQVQANEVALNGVREEARVGQRTTLDVLNAQQELLNARVALVQAQRDRVIFSYGVVQAVGRPPLASSRCRWPPTVPRSTTIRSRTSGTACAQRTVADRR